MIVSFLEWRKIWLKDYVKFWVRLYENKFMFKNIVGIF